MKLTMANHVRVGLFEFRTSSLATRVTASGVNVGQPAVDLFATLCSVYHCIMPP